MLRRFNMWQRRNTDFIDEKFTMAEHATYLGISLLLMAALLAIFVAALLAALRWLFS